jgi:hypothetical protein
VPARARRRAPVERSVARVVDKTEKLVGLAFAVGDSVLTCAHVVNAALGRPDLDPTPPSRRDRIRLEFPSPTGDPALVLYTSVKRWLPAELQQWHNVGDIAVLEPDVHQRLPTSVAPAHLGELDYRTVVRVYGFNEKRGHEVVLGGTLMGSPSTGLMVVVNDAAFPVTPGFSGGPVWYADSGLVVGMVVTGATGKGPVDIYLVASDRLDQVLPGPSQVRSSWRATPRRPRGQAESRALMLANPRLAGIPVLVGLIAGVQAAGAVTAGRAVLHAVVVALVLWCVTAVVAAGAPAVWRWAKPLRRRLRPSPEAK